MLTSSVEFYFRLISPDDCPSLYRLVVHKSCEMWVPNYGLCSPQFPKIVDFVVHIFLIYVTNFKMATMLMPREATFFMWTPLGLHCYSQ